MKSHDLDLLLISKKKRLNQEEILKIGYHSTKGLMMSKNFIYELTFCKTTEICIAIILWNERTKRKVISDDFDPVR